MIHPLVQIDRGHRFIHSLGSKGSDQPISLSPITLDVLAARAALDERNQRRSGGDRGLIHRHRTHENGVCERD